LESRDPKYITEFFKQHQNSFNINSDTICNQIWGKVFSNNNVSHDVLKLLANHTHIDQYSSVIKQAVISMLTDNVIVLLKSTPYSTKEISPQYTKILIEKAFISAAFGEKIDTLNGIITAFPDNNLNPLENENLLTYSLAMEPALISLRFLFQLAQTKNRNLVTELLEINQSFTPLLCSVIQNPELEDSELVDVVNLLIEFKADVNAPISSPIFDGKEYPLGLAVRRGNIEIIKKLIDHNANITAMNIWKAKMEIYTGTALHIAYRCRQEAIVEYLIKICPELVSIPNSNGELPHSIKKKSNH